MSAVKPRGDQLNIQDIAAEIAVDPTAISSIATGVTSDPAAQAILDSEYLRVDGVNVSANPGEVMVFDSGSPQGWDSRLLIEADISDLQSYVLTADIGSTVQAWDSDLDGISALTPTAGQGLVYEGSPLGWNARALVEADISDLQSYLLPADIGSTVQAWDGDLDTFAGLTPTAGWALIADGSPAAWTSRALVEADISDLQSYLLPADIGSTVQAWDGDLDTFAGLTPTPGWALVGSSGSPSTWEARVLVEADISDLQSYLLPADIGSTVQAWDGDLDTIAGLTPTAGWALIADGSPAAWTSRALVEADISDLQTYLLDITSESLADLSDVAYTGSPAPVVNDYLCWDGSKWTNSGDVVTAAGYSADLAHDGSPPSRVPGDTYTNMTGKPLTLAIRMVIDSVPSAVEVDFVPVSSFTAIPLGSPEATMEVTHSVLVPAGSTYKLVGGGVITAWYEVQ